MRPEAKIRRSYWVSELAKLSGSFGDDSTRMLGELRAEIEKDGVECLLDHIRFCGAMPEQYEYNSSEEKLYSKYTDAIISEAFTAMNLRSTIISARADVADVQAKGDNYSLVADAKAFRLSRTAKNQKDFKIQAMDGWRGGLDYAVLVCPIYQLPSRTSQIYRQAVARNVCVLSYTHLAVMVGFSSRSKVPAVEQLFHNVLKSVSVLHPSKSAVDYWTGINRSFVNSLGKSSGLWTTEKTESLDALSAAKEESLRYLRAECNRLLGLSHQEALDELIHANGLDSRIAQVERIKHSNLLEV